MKTGKGKSSFVFGTPVNIITSLRHKLPIKCVGRKKREHREKRPLKTPPFSLFDRKTLFPTISVTVIESWRKHRYKSLMVTRFFWHLSNIFTLSCYSRIHRRNVENFLRFLLWMLNIWRCKGFQEVVNRQIWPSFSPLCNP